MPLADVLKTDEGGHPKPLKLLTLFGRTKGDLQWRVNCYSDGSGSSTEEVLLFPSEELAVEALKDHAHKRLEFYAENLGRLYGAEKWVAIAKVFKLEIPAPVVNALKAQKRSAAQKAKAKALSDLEAAEAELASIEGGEGAASD